MRTIKCPNCGTEVQVPKSPSQQELGQAGGKARLETMTEVERKAVAKLGGAARWAGHQKKTKPPT